MKKYLIIAAILVTLLITGFITFTYFSSFKDIVFEVKQSDLTIDVYKTDEEDKKISSFKSGTTLSLQPGEYYYVTNGEKFDSTRYSFTLDGSAKTITINPDYSNNYLTKVLLEDKISIEAVVNSAYPNLMPTYEFFSSQLFKQGEWYGAVLRKTVDNEDSFKDTYRVVLHKVDGNWVLVHNPEIVVTKANFSDVPVDVLNAINNLVYS